MTENVVGKVYVIKSQRHKNHSEARDQTAYLVRSWQGYFDLIATFDIPDDFLSDRSDGPPHRHGLFKLLSGRRSTG